MLNETEYLLVVLAEECAEIAKQASKGIRFGLDDFEPGQSETNTRRIERELADLMAVVERLGFRIKDEDKFEKQKKLSKYMDHSRRLGYLES